MDKGGSWFGVKECNKSRLRVSWVVIASVSAADVGLSASLRLPDSAEAIRTAAEAGVDADRRSGDDAQHSIESVGVRGSIWSGPSHSARERVGWFIDRARGHPSFFGVNRRTPVRGLGSTWQPTHGLSQVDKMEGEKLRKRYITGEESVSAKSRHRCLDHFRLCSVTRQVPNRI